MDYKETGFYMIGMGVGQLVLMGLLLLIGHELLAALIAYNTTQIGIGIWGMATGEW